MKARDFGYDRKASRVQNTARFNFALVKGGNTGMIRLYLLEKEGSSNDRFHVAFDETSTTLDSGLLPPELASARCRGMSSAGCSSTRSRIRIRTGGSQEGSSNDRFYVAFNEASTALDNGMLPPELAFARCCGMSSAGCSSSRIRIRTGGSHVHVECDCDCDCVFDESRESVVVLCCAVLCSVVKSFVGLYLDSQVFQSYFRKVYGQVKLVVVVFDFCFQWKNEPRSVGLEHYRYPQKKTVFISFSAL
jgi:hypothetical protein